MPTPAVIDPARLRELLGTRLSLTELKDLAFDLNLDDEALPYDNKPDLARELLKRLRQLKRPLSEIVSWLRANKREDVVADLATASVQPQPDSAPHPIPAVTIPILPSRSYVPQPAITAPSGSASLGIGLRPDGVPDIAWCEVPAGEFLMGSSESDEMAGLDEKPQLKVRLEAFHISKYPITNAQYAAFTAAGGYQKPQYWTRVGWIWRSEKKIEGPERSPEPFGLDDHPVVGVSWYEAVAFAAWLSERLGFHVALPSESQWEKAARGTDGRRYPWGPDRDPARANCVESGIGATSAVGRFPRGASPYGAQDMSGNVWEWCATRWQGSYQGYQDDSSPEADVPRVLRGGSFSNNERFVRCASRNRNYPYSRYGSGGFRVVASPILL